MDDHQERELRAEFEAWAKAAKLDLTKCEDGSYFYSDEQVAWDAFRAGRRSSPSTQRQGEEAQQVWIVDDDRGEHVMMCPAKPTAEAMDALAAKIERNVFVREFMLTPVAIAHPADAPEGGK